MTMQRTLGFEPFTMERFQSTYEHGVDFNLSDSGVRPLPIGEFLKDDAWGRGLIAESSGYAPTRGSVELRALVAKMHPGATARNVQITNGGTEANYLVARTVLAPGDEVVCVVPGYMQVAGIARNMGAAVKPWPLVPSDGHHTWNLDLNSLPRLMTRRTKAIVISNPNNPTGSRLADADLDAVVRVTERRNIWILADEIFRGAEFHGNQTRSLWGRSSKVIVTGGLSKAYGLPGLRIGWIVAPHSIVATCWAYHDYTSVAVSTLSDRFASRALQPPRRAHLLSRTRHILSSNFSIVSQWLESLSAHFEAARPQAGAIVYVRCGSHNSLDLACRLRNRSGVLVLPGEHFGHSGYLRIGFGQEPAYLETALARVARCLGTVGELSPRRSARRAMP